MPGSPIPSFLKLILAMTLAVQAAPAPSAPPNPEPKNLRLEVASQWEAKGEYDKAVQELRLYMSEHPENSGAIYARIGGLRMKQGNFKLAGENFKIALAKEPDLTVAREGLAQAYEKLGDKDKADEERRKLRAPAVASGAKPGATVPAGATSAPNAVPATAAAPTPAAPAAGSSGAPNRPAAAPGPASTGKVPAPAHAANEELPPPHAESAPAASIPDFSPALDSGASKGPEGIYADKDFLAALEFYRQGKLDAMAAPLRRCLARHPGHPGAYYLGGVMRYDKGEFAKALFNFKRALAYPDRGFNAHFYMGRIYQRQERFPQAVAEYKEYLKATQSPAGRKRAEAFLAQMGEGNPPATPGSGKETPASGANAGEAKAAAAGGKAGEGEPGEAKAAEGKAGAEGDHGAPPLAGTSSKQAAHEEEGKPAEAGGKPKEAAAPKPPPAPVPASEAKALVLGRDGGFFFLIPDENAPSGKKLREAHLLVKAEKYEKAVNALKEIMLSYGGSDNAAAAGLDLASVYLQLGLWDQARDRVADHLGTASRDSVKYYDAAQYLAALAQLGLKDGEKAEKCLQKIKPGSANAPDQEEIDRRLTQAGALMQDPKKQSAYLEKAYAGAKDPVRKAGYARDLGGLHAKYGGLDKAAGWYGKAASECKDPKDSVLASLCAEVQLRMADIAFRKKDWKGAMDQYRKFAARWPEHKESAWVHYQMANIYKATRNFESALNEYKRVIDNYPDSYWASQAKWKREDAIWRKEYEEVLD
jgi:tetratricopeptide (TPR) repeat protein